jgi:hypothetical protein
MEEVKYENVDKLWTAAYSGLALIRVGRNVPLAWLQRLENKIRCDRWRQ